MSTTASSVHWTSDKVLQVLETFTDSTVLADFPGLTDYCVTLLELQFAVSFLPITLPLSGLTSCCLFSKNCSYWKIRDRFRVELQSDREAQALQAANTKPFFFILA
jgi:hypothetical protein